MTFISELFSNLYFLSGLAVLVSFVISVRLFPAIIQLSHTKNLMDEPSERSMHQRKTPTLGGVGLFIAFSLGLILLGIFTNLDRVDLVRLLALIGGAIILLFLGLKDDLMVLSARKKFVGQLIAILLVVFTADVRIMSMDGIFGLGYFHYSSSILFTVFVFTLIINSFNLIDGIDGLAGGIAIMISLFYGMFFVVNGEYLMSFVAFLFIGGLIGFLTFNLSNKKKLFMGDSGSLFSGFVIAYLTVSFLNVNSGQNAQVMVSNAPVLAIAILSYPMMDTLRVFIVRMRAGVSPFKADRNHIHHRLLSLGLSHKRASLTLVSTNLTIVLFVLSAQFLEIHLHLLLCISFGVVTYLMPFLSIFDKKAQELETITANDTSEKQIKRTVIDNAIAEDKTVNIAEAYKTISSIKKATAPPLKEFKAANTLTDVYGEFTKEGKVKDGIKKKTALGSYLKELKETEAEKKIDENKK